MAITTAQNLYPGPTDQDQAWGTDVRKLDTSIPATASWTMTFTATGAVYAQTVDPYTNTSAGAANDNRTNLGWAINEAAASADSMGSATNAQRRIPAGNWVFTVYGTMNASALLASRNTSVEFSVYRVATGGGTRTLLFSVTSNVVGTDSLGNGATGTFTATSNQPLITLGVGETLHVAYRVISAATSATLGGVTNSVVTLYVGTQAGVTTTVQVPAPGIRTTYGRQFTAGATQSGALRKVPLKVFAAGITPTNVGIVKRVILRSLSGSITPIGVSGGAPITEVFSTSGADDWTAPAGVTSAFVECIGAGGAGRRADNVEQTAGGGGGGAYAASIVPVTPGNVYNLQVGAGGLGTTVGGGETAATPSWFQNTSTVYADFGKSPAGASSGGLGGSAASSVGTTTVSGVAGSANGPGGAGASGGTLTGGDGGAFPSSESPGNPGAAPGGGGSSGRGGPLAPPQAGGNGATGIVQITYTPPGGVSNLVKIPQKDLAAMITPSPGVLVRHVSRALAGTVPTSGSLRRLVFKPLTGSIASASTIRNTVVRYFTGAIGSVGSLRKVPVKRFVATIASSGGLVKRPIKRLTATITSTGVISARNVAKFFTATITSTGALRKVPATFRSGAIGSTGSIRKVPNKYFTGLITPTPGTIIRAIVKYFTGSMSSAGSITMTIAKRLQGFLAPQGFQRNVIAKFFRGFFYGPTGDGSGGGPTIVRKVFQIFDD